MKTGVLFLHGFTGGTFEIRPFVQYIKERTDWTLSTPVYPGHDFPVDLRRVSAESWMMEAELALAELRKQADRIIIVGFSMGGMIALYLALRYPVDRIVLLSAAAKYISPRVLLEDAAVMLSESITKRYPANTFYHLYGYKLKETPLHAAVEFLRVVKMVEPYYSQVTCPVCIVQGRKDGIVPFSAGDHLYRSIGSQDKRMIVSDEGKHHICYSDDAAEWFADVFEFMKEKESRFSD